jgi:parallel beta-helix repeat protein
VVALLFATLFTGAFRIASTRAVLSPSRVDNLIITSSDLDAAALKLAQWKNSCGIPSIVLNVEWINSTYSGVDEPEKIRNCIKDYYSNFQIKYVTIFGDADKVPTRYVYIPDSNDDSNFTATDLYYASLNGTWDDNHDGLYGDQRYDYVSVIPDVYIGRIPVESLDSAQAVVDKIENYQQQFNVSQDWTRRIVLAAGTGDNGGWFNPSNLGNATTVLNDNISQIIVRANVVELYESAGNLSTDRITSEINKGALFVNFAGHGSPGTESIFDIGWLFYWTIRGPLLWNGFKGSDAQSLTNGFDLPVVTTMSCSTARFDDTECMGEDFVLDPTGGAIAYFGSTRVSYCYLNDFSPNGFMGEMDRNIYENFYKGFTRLGQMWGETVREYAQSHVQNYQNAYWEDVKTVMEFVLLGDPTLRIYNAPETMKVPEQYATIQGAINDAYDGDTIEIAPGEYHENIIVNKTVSILGADRENTILDSCGVYVTAQEVTISNLTVRNSSSSCIYLFNANFCDISRNVFDSSYMGVFLSNSSYDQVSSNTVTNSTYGICSFFYSNFNVISDNTISENRDGVCFSLLCYGSFVSHNTITDNVDGILLYSSSNNRIFGNNVTANSYVGILFNWSSNYNSVIGNNITGNAYRGIGLYSNSSGNMICHNNFIDNYQQAYSDSMNIWDDGYPSGGNYWSDYAGVDLCTGPWQNLTGSDGIGDTPYAIDSSNLDNYPLIAAWAPPDIAVTNLTSAKTVIGQGYTCSVDVTFENLGNKIEAFNATVYANSTYIQSEQTMLGMTNCTLGFRWNTTGFAFGNYAVTAYADPVPSETNTANNNVTGGTIYVGIPGDVNGDGTVDILDAIVQGNSFLATPRSSNWNPNADINGDNIVNILDAIILSNHFLQHYP